MLTNGLNSDFDTDECVFEDNFDSYSMQCPRLSEGNSMSRHYL